jgi:hypothetical protein
VDSTTLEELSLNTPEYPLYEDQVEGAYQPALDADEMLPSQVQAEITSEYGDNYFGAEVDLPHHGTVLQGKVKRRARDADGVLFGAANNNPILDTRMSQVEFPDSSSSEYAANKIAENMYSQCDPIGKQHVLFKAIIDHEKDSNAIGKDQDYSIQNGRQHRLKTTKDCKLCVEWINGTTSWVRLAELKASLLHSTQSFQPLVVFIHC